METRSQRQKRVKHHAYKQQSEIHKRPELIHQILCEFLNGDVFSVILQYISTSFALFTGGNSLQFWNMDTMSLDHTSDILTQTSGERRSSRIVSLVNNSTLLIPIIRYSPTSKVIKFWTLDLCSFQVTPPSNSKHKIQSSRANVLLLATKISGGPSTWIAYYADRVLSGYCWATKQTRRYPLVKDVLWFGVDGDHLTVIRGTSLRHWLSVQQINLTSASEDFFFPVLAIDTHPTDDTHGFLVRLPIRDILSASRAAQRLYIHAASHHPGGVRHWVIDIQSTAVCELKAPLACHKSMTPISSLLDGGNKMIFKCFHEMESVFDGPKIDRFVVNFCDLHNPVWTELVPPQGIICCESFVGEYFSSL